MNEKEFREIFAERLKDLRQERGLSLKKLESETGISRSALFRLENNKVEANMHQIITLAEYFGVTTDYLLCREN